MEVLWMTEKRFRLTDDGILDTKTGEEYVKISSGDSILNLSCGSVFTVLNLLNDMDEKNKKLCKHIKAYEEALMDANDEIEHLKNVMSVLKKFKRLLDEV